MSRYYKKVCKWCNRTFITTNKKQKLCPKCTEIEMGITLDSYD